MLFRGRLYIDNVLNSEELVRECRDLEESQRQLKPGGAIAKRFKSFKTKALNVEPTAYDTKH